MIKICETCKHTLFYCRCKLQLQRGDEMINGHIDSSKHFKTEHGDELTPCIVFLPHEVIKRIVVLNRVLQDDHRNVEANEINAIFQLCEEAFANEFDRGYELAQEEVQEWYEPRPYPDQH